MSASNRTHRPVIVASLLGLEDRILDEGKALRVPTGGVHYRREERKRLDTLILEPGDGIWHASRIDLACPGIACIDGVDVSHGEFITSAVGDIDGDSQREIVCGVTLSSGECYLMSCKLGEHGSMMTPIAEYRGGDVNLIRSISLGDVDGDGCEEIVIGTRPSGLVILLRRAGDGYSQEVIDRDPYGPFTSNTREVHIADVDNDGALEILAATARTNQAQWESTPGALFMFKQSGGRWHKRVIDDHGGRTHTRMCLVGGVRNDGLNHLVSTTVGIHDAEHDVISPKPQVMIYRVSRDSVEKVAIDVLEQAIKSRSLAIGDVDGDQLNELVLGTRNLDARGETFLFSYKYDIQRQTWARETLDKSGELGFHRVAIADVDGDGRSEVIASDDGKGLIRIYRKDGGTWTSAPVLGYPHAIFTASLDVVDAVAGTDAGG